MSTLKAIKNGDTQQQMLSSLFGSKNFPDHLIQGNDFGLHEEPLIILMACHETNELAQLDLGICAQLMMPTARQLGFDNCSVGLVKITDFTNNFSKPGMPETNHVNLAIVFGYGSEAPELQHSNKNNIVFI